LYQTIKHQFHYGLNGPGFEFLWERRLLWPSRLVPKTTHPLVQGFLAFFSGEKLVGACRLPPTPI